MATKKKSQKIPQHREGPEIRATEIVLSYIKGTTDGKDQTLRRYIFTTYKPARTSRQILPNAKEKILQENQGIYKIVCGLLGCLHWTDKPTNICKARLAQSRF